MTYHCTLKLDVSIETVIRQAFTILVFVLFCLFVFYFCVVTFTFNLACVVAVSFPFPGGDRTSERKSGRAKEHAWGFDPFT